MTNDIDINFNQYFLLGQLYKKNKVKIMKTSLPCLFSISRAIMTNLTAPSSRYLPISLKPEINRRLDFA